MSKPPETTSSTATRQIRPPPLSQHLREFASRRDAWVVLARNMIPVVGIYAFGWSAAVSVFNYWFDGLTALAAIVAAMVPRALRETQSKKGPRDVGRQHCTRRVCVAPARRHCRSAVLDRVDSAPRSSPRQRIAAPARAFSGALVHFRLARSESFLESVPHGLRHMPDKELKQRARWDLYLLILRAIAMFFMAAHGLYFILVPLMALLLSYLEIWPDRAIGAVFGDPSRLWEYDPGDPTSNRRLP